MDKQELARIEHQNDKALRMGVPVGSDIQKLRAEIERLQNEYLELAEKSQNWKTHIAVQDIQLAELQRENAELQSNNQLLAVRLDSTIAKLAAAEAVLNNVALAVAALPTLPVKPFGKYQASLFTNCQKIIVAIDAAKTEVNE